MSCLCRQEACVNLLKIYQNNNLLFRNHLFFEVIYPPRIYLTQRLININNDKRTVRNIIKIFNFEQTSFENINFINEIKPVPKEIKFNCIEGIWYYDKGRLVVKIPKLESLGIKTIDYCICIDNECVYSKIYLKDINLNNGNIKTCINKLNLKA